MTPLAVGALIEVEVGAPAHGGSCVARHIGQVVFVRHALPGERVRARVTEQSKHFARADAVDVLAASVHRVVPPCPAARPGGCGGCDWQHAAAGFQREIKATVVMEQLSRLAGIDRHVVVEALPTPSGPEGATVPFDAVSVASWLFSICVTCCPTVPAS